MQGLIYPRRLKSTLQRTCHGGSGIYRGRYAHIRKSAENYFIIHQIAYGNLYRKSSEILEIVYYVIRYFRAQARHFYRIGGNRGYPAHAVISDIHEAVIRISGFKNSTLR